MRLSILSLAGIIVVALFFQKDTCAQTTQIQYLSGHGTDDAVEWDFYCTGGRNNGVWTKIPVPSQWELHGFGTYNYGHDSNKASEQGRYAHSFTVPSSWNGKRVFIVFEGSMTDTEVRINDQSAGSVHQGAFYRFSYEITDKLNYTGSNQLEVTVSKMSSNSSVNSAERDADYWIFGGIFRPVYLEAYPQEYIKRIAVNAQAGGAITVDVFLDGISSNATVEAQVKNLDGTNVGAAFSQSVSSGTDGVRLSATINGVSDWSAETPHLYSLQVSLTRSGTPVHIHNERIGFRTVEVRSGNGIYINGKKMMFRGVNRHSFWPSSGRALNTELILNDVLLLKKTNMNAVRNSHYPKDRHFYDYCDSLGLYVLDELAGWQSRYDTDIGRKLIEEMVTYNVNHPCIILWDNGNEGGWNTALDGEFSNWDPQNRRVMHPWTTFSGVNTSHYQTYSSTQNILNQNTIFMPTEYLHGLYDGGHGAGLEDYWRLMRSRPLSAGGFLWVFADEAVVRTDQNNAFDTDGNHAPDGIFGPYHEPEGSFYTIREIFSPIHIAMSSLPDNFNGTIELENRYDFTNLNRCSFTWKLVTFDFLNPDSGYTLRAEGSATTGSISPGARGDLSITLPAVWQESDALLLEAFDPTDRRIANWSWMIVSPTEMRQDVVLTEGTSAVTVQDSQSTVTLRAENLAYTFSKTSGRLTRVLRDGDLFSLTNGPSLSTGSATFQSMDVTQEGNDYLVDITYTGNLRKVVWRVFSSGWLSLHYEYALNGDYDYFGIDFEYPESRVVGAQWMGKGPYRVWKNRMKGTTYNLWKRAYNDAITGYVWDYPEFKGYFANSYWARLLTDEGTIHFVVDSPDIFLRLFTPKNGPNPQNATFAIPGNDISFMHGISPTGTKFLSASSLGPQSQRYSVNDTYTGTIYFYFGDVSDIPVAIGKGDDGGKITPAAMQFTYQNPGRFRLFNPASGSITIELFSLSGKKLATFHSGHTDKGWHEFSPPHRPGAGLYIYRLKRGAVTVTRGIVPVY